MFPRVVVFVNMHPPSGEAITINVLQEMQNTFTENSRHTHTKPQGETKAQETKSGEVGISRVRGHRAA